MRTELVLTAALGLVLATPLAARADDAVHLGAATLDRPTLVTIGVRWALTGDDDFDATVTVQYREAGATEWIDAMPLRRVRADLVAGGGAVPELAGSIFDLAPATTYEIRLTAHDPDGGDQTTTLTQTTRAVPADPKTPRAVPVSTAAELTSALAAAQPGDVITLAAGTYAGEFTLNASGTADDPIVIRGADRDAVVLDGGEGGSNVLAIEGSYTHVERLTLQHDTRALRFHGSPATGNVVRRVHAKDVRLGFGSNPSQQDFYICDNVLEGRLAWPMVYADDGGAHANDDGIHVEGDGHVVCHNTLSGFGDALKVETVGARADDFYGNDVNGAYDNAIELDQSQGNTRAFRNRFTNAYMPVSCQPILGGPAYVVRNLVVNAAVEQVKLHNATVGPVILNNTFVSPAYAFQVLDDTTARAVTMTNNLFIGPSAPQGGRAVNWDQPVDPATDVIDWNGWSPDGAFHMGIGANGTNYASFSALSSGGKYEAHGRLVAGGTLFASGLVAPASYTTNVTPIDGTLAAGSDAIDHGTPIPNVTDGFRGTAPDLGAAELGCAVPIYGVRPEGVDESNEPVGCAGTNGGGGGGDSDGGGGGPNGGGPGADGGGAPGGGDAAAGPGDGGSTGCGCRLASRSGTGALAALAGALGAFALAARRRRERGGR
jgi:hypothetical protein